MTTRGTWQKSTKTIQWVLRSHDQRLPVRQDLNMELRLSWLIFPAVRNCSRSREDWSYHAAAGAAPSGWGHPERFLNQVRMVMHSQCRGRHGEPNVPVLAERCGNPLQPVLQILIRIRIRNRSDPYHLPGSGSVSYSNEHNKINWKGKFNKKCLLVGSWQTYWQWKSS
jgi:hypothetical protein